MAVVKADFVWNCAACCPFSRSHTWIWPVEPVVPTLLLPGWQHTFQAVTELHSELNKPYKPPRSGDSVSFSSPVSKFHTLICPSKPALTPTVQLSSVSRAYLQPLVFAETETIARAEASITHCFSRSAFQMPILPSTTPLLMTQRIYLILSLFCPSSKTQPISHQHEHLLREI